MASAVPEKKEWEGVVRRRNKDKLSTGAKLTKAEIKARRHSVASGKPGSSTSATSLDPSSAGVPEHKARRQSVVVRWFKYITDATESYKNKEGSRNRRPGSVKAPEVALPETPVVGGLEDSVGEKTPERKTSKDDGAEVSVAGATLGSEAYSKASGSVDSLEALGKVEVLQIDQSNLIQPTEVVVSDAVFVETADEPQLSPQESVVQKEALIRTTMEEKKSLVADILNIPLQDYDNIAEMACEMDGEKDQRELLLASISQADRLTALINASLSLPPAAPPQTPPPPYTMDPPPVPLRIIEEGELEGATAAVPPSESSTKEPSEGSASSSDGKPSRPDSGEMGTKGLTVTVSAQQLLSISAKLNEQLTQLLTVVTAQEAEREKLKIDLESAQEQVTALMTSDPASATPPRIHPGTSYSPHRSPSNSFSGGGGGGENSRPNSYISVTSSASETTDTAHDTDSQALPSGDDASMLSSPATPGPSVIASQQDVHVEFERLHIIEEPATEEGPADAATHTPSLHADEGSGDQNVEDDNGKTPSGDQTEEEEGFVDANTDPEESDGSNNNVVDNSLNTSSTCAVEDSDTHSPVIGASF